MVPQIIGVIVPRATGNSQGGHFFIRLDNGRGIHRNIWTDLPMSNELIDRVHVLDCHSKYASGFTVGCRDRTKIVDEPYDEPDQAL